MAPSDLQKSTFSSEPAVIKIFAAPAADASWMPAMDTADAPACQRTLSPGLKQPTRWSACVAVIQV